MLGLVSPILFLIGMPGLVSPLLLLIRMSGLVYCGQDHQPGSSPFGAERRAARSSAPTGCVR
ncbi:MAG TPA: hypothetical protein VIP51_10410, partial [Eoetvoesiella sp.]